VAQKKILIILWIVALLVGLFLYNRYEFVPSDTNNQKDPAGAPSNQPGEKNNKSEGFNRRPEKIIYTKHARCRMACRQINEMEIKEILARGIINRQKSDPASRPDPKYALEGLTRDGQQVRIIFAESDRGMVVVTVIDLEKEWNCNCK
jgi:hypothetical protein